MGSRGGKRGVQLLLVTSRPLQVRLLRAARGSLHPVAMAAVGSHPPTQLSTGMPRFHRITDRHSGHRG